MEYPVGYGCFESSNTGYAYILSHFSEKFPIPTPLSELSECQESDMDSSRKSEGP